MKTSRRLLAKLLLILLVIGVMGVAVNDYRSHRGRDTMALQRQDEPAVSVTTARATRQDVPIYVTGIGTVQALDTIAIHTQVDGTLESVSFTEGQEVRQGDLLAQIDPRMFQAALDQAKAKKAADQAQLAGAEKDLQRFQFLVAKNAEARQNLDQQQALVNQITANVEADQAAIESAQTQLDYSTITAPVDGRVGIRQIDPGNVVHPSDTTPVVVLTRMKPITVVFSLPQMKLGAIREGLKGGPLPVMAYDQDSEKALAEGRVEFVDNAIDPTTGTIRLKAVFPNNGEELWPGQFVNVRLRQSLQKGAITIPSAAVQHGPNGLYAWVIEPNQRAAMRPIQIGTVEKNVTVITSGVKDAERVVVDGAYGLEPEVRVVEAEPSSSGTRLANERSGP